MRKALLLGILLSVSQAASGETLESCLLDRAPGVANDVAATAVYRVCSGKPKASQGEGRSVWNPFSYSSGAECAADKAASTRSISASKMIFMACNTLYDEPAIFDPATAVRVQ